MNRPPPAYPDTRPRDLTPTPVSIHFSVLDFTPDRTGVLMNRQTTLAKNDPSPQAWWIVDATDMIMGRLSTKIAMILMGKTKPTYTPHHLVGDGVVVINVDKMRMTGNKAEQKTFQTYVFYPSGQKNFTYKWMMENKPEMLLERSVRRMLPKNKLAAKMLKSLKIYKGSEHPHQAQMPQAMAV